MARKQYFVVKHNGEWKVTHDGNRSSAYPTQRAAIRAAVDSAHGVGKQGFDAQVLVQGEDNQFRTEWTYGKDPYPPKG